MSTSSDDPEIYSEGDDSGWETESVEEEKAIPPLLPLPSGLASPNDSLCDVCKNLKLTRERFVVLPGDPETGNEPDNPNIPLGFVRDIKKKVNCPFCRLVLFAIGGPDHIDDIPVYEDGEAVSVLLSWSTDGPIPDYDEPWNHTPQVRRLRPYIRKAGGDYANSEQLNLFPEITLLANDSPSSPAFFVRPIQEDQIDFGMIQNWLSICQRWHGPTCDRAQMFDQINPAEDIPFFRLIDVINNCIVRAPSGCKYATLSYVWGRVSFLQSLKSNIDALEQPRSLLRPEFLDQISRTLLDSMQVVRELNLQYLWVDSLCIVQDDERHKKEIIGSMDLVYGSCFLTIMAATGKDANAGLPGVRPGTRGRRQHIEEIMPGLRLAFKEMYQNYIKDAIYYTRAWTFQEQTFTPRSLVFIGGQVVFRCVKADQWREDVVFEERRIAGDGDVEGMKSKDDIGNIEGMIQSYSGLALTYDSDVYNGFAGIYRHFKTHLKINLCHGVPDAYFDWCLLWGALKPQERRKGAPSWSWSGWIGESWPRIWDWYTRSIPMIRKALRHRTWIIWYQRVAHDSTEFVRVWTPTLTAHSSKSELSLNSKNFYGGPIVNRFPFDCSQTQPTPRKLLNAPKYYDDTFNPNPGSGFLQFWTVSVKFNLDTPTSRNDTEGPRNTHVRTGLFGRDGREIGTIMVKESWRSANVPGKHEFILLCEGRDERAKGGREDREPGWKYMIMLLEWHGEWAERVSVGSIEFKADIVQALEPGPVWKEVILG